MPTIFSHPSYPVTDNYSTVAYNLMVSRANGNTYSSAPVTAGSGVIVTPASMTNIAVGSILDIEPGSPSWEQVTVTAASTTFTANFTKNHSANFVIQSQSLSPAFFGPWTIIQSGYTSNIGVVDMSGTIYDLYRVQPIVQNNAGGPVPGPQIGLDWSRAFHSTTPLYDAQISSLMDNFRKSYLKDIGIKATDSTVPTESTGQGMLPFITDANTSRFYLSFIPNADPVKFRESDLIVISGATSSLAKALVPYKDYYASVEGGYIDFSINPAADTYLRTDYTTFEYNDDECRSLLTNAISEVPLFGIIDDTFEIKCSNNYYYLVSPIPDRDVAQIICAIAQKNALGADIMRSFRGSEEFQIKQTRWAADPSRSIQAGTLWNTDLVKSIKSMAANYIRNTRSYFSRGEFDSFFDNAGVLYPPFSIYNVFNYMSWWL